MESGKVCEEAVYGGFWVRALYGTSIGRLLSILVAAPPVSRLCGWLQDRPSSARKVGPFVQRYGIRLEDFVSEEGRSPESPYSSFNAFFTRRLAAGARPFVQHPQVPAPADARYFAYDRLDEAVSVPVKGTFFTAQALLRDPEWSRIFQGGPGFVARLCPVDYHRFHFPDDGEVVAQWRVAGVLHSVNPWALAGRPDIFMLNERNVSILQTAHLGRLAYVEIGATCVGRIVSLHRGGPFRRGDEKGMFLFGGSTLIVIGEPGRWAVEPGVLANTAKGLETYIETGRGLGVETPAADGPSM
jgi:phosphatidylserine decarboxylase